MKTPDDIKKGLKHCGNYKHCSKCVYNEGTCIDGVLLDALAYIRQLEKKCHQLERERDALLDALHGECDVCAYYNSMSGKCTYCKHDADAWNVCEDNWEWRGFKEDEK